MPRLADALEPDNIRTDKVLALYNTLDVEDRETLKAVLFDEVAYSSAGLARTLQRVYGAPIDPAQVVNLRAKLRQGKATL